MEYRIRFQDLLDFNLIPLGTATEIKLKGIKERKKPVIEDALTEIKVFRLERLLSLFALGLILFTSFLMFLAVFASSSNVDLALIFPAYPSLILIFFLVTWLLYFIRQWIVSNIKYKAYQLKAVMRDIKTLELNGLKKKGKGSSNILTESFFAIMSIIYKEGENRFLIRRLPYFSKRSHIGTKTAKGRLETMRKKGFLKMNDDGYYEMEPIEFKTVSDTLSDKEKQSVSKYLKFLWEKLLDFEYGIVKKRVGKGVKTKTKS
jgi:hypothetical protein